MDPPLAPALLSPADGAVLDTLIPTFSWDTSALPATPEYNSLCLGFGTNPNPSCHLYINTTERGVREWLPWDNLAPGTLYYWRVGVLDDGNSNDIHWSEEWSLTTGSDGIILSPPTLLSPPDGSTITLEAAQFEWTAVPGSVEYKASFCQLNACNLRFTSETQLDLSMFQNYFDAGEYTWHIMARNEYAWSAPSEEWTFIFQPSAVQVEETMASPSYWTMGATEDRIQIFTIE
jgi:hypothetical protein